LYESRKQHRYIHQKSVPQNGERLTTAEESGKKEFSYTKEKGRTVVYTIVRSFFCRKREKVTQVTKVSL